MAEDSVVICGYGEVGKMLVNKLGAAIDYDGDDEEGEESSSSNKNNILPQVVVFDTKPSLINKTLMPRPNVAVMYGDGENPEILHSHGVFATRAIFILMNIMNRYWQLHRGYVHHLSKHQYMQELRTDKRPKN